MKPLHLIAAMASNRIIGCGAEIPWRANGEQKLFRQITLGNTLIMGRRTFESIGRPLPGRQTIIITRQRRYHAPDCHIARDIDAALQLAQALPGDMFIAGGGQIYRQTLERADHLHLTTIDIEARGDIRFPDYEQTAFRLVKEDRHSTNLDYIYRHLQRQ